MHLGVPLSSRQSCPSGQTQSRGQDAMWSGTVALRSIGNGKSSGGGHTGKQRGMSLGARQRCPLGQVTPAQGLCIGNGSSGVGRMGWHLGMSSSARQRWPFGQVKPEQGSSNMPSGMAVMLSATVATKKAWVMKYAMSMVFVKGR